MPFYEYTAKDVEKSCNHCYNILTVRQGMKEEPLTECPHCLNGVAKMVSTTRVVVKGKEANQYNDIKQAKYWRDSNGVRHKVTPQDGYSKSPTIPNRKTATPEEVKQRRKTDDKKNKKQRNTDSYNKFVKSVKKK